MSFVPDTTISEHLLRRDRLIVVAGLTLICTISWAWIIGGAGTGMSSASMSTWQFPAPTGMKSMVMGWDVPYWLLMLSMWWIMMIAMMIPSATPMVLLYARVCRHAQKQGRMAKTLIPTMAFTLGYLLAWLVFSLAAVGLQWALEKAGLMHSMMMWSTSTKLSAAFLIMAGIYQLSPLKHVCLKHCRSPVDFLSRNFRSGHGGALFMGLHHGLYCVGCCWFLMVLLFAGGIMNLVWISGLAIIVLLEKLLPYGQWFARITGGLLLAGSVVLLVA